MSESKPSVAQEQILALLQEQFSAPMLHLTPMTEARLHKPSPLQSKGKTTFSVSPAI